MHIRHNKQTTPFCLIFLYEVIILMNKNKNNYFTFVNENRNILVHSRYDTLIKRQSSQKHFEIIHKVFTFQLKLPSFLDQTSTFSVLTPNFSRNGFYNFFFQNPSKNSDFIICIITTCM